MKNRGYRFIRIIGALALIILILASSGCGLPSYGARSEASLIADNHNCRFWCIVSGSASTSVIQEQLVTDPNSLKNLSYSNVNGWSVGYYHDNSSMPSVPTVNRGKSPAYSDPLFDSAVAEAAGAIPRIVVSHVRNCSSGLCDIANPHPFEREKNGMYWLMGHNGTIDKTVLLSLIRPDYLTANPPVYGTDQSQWIDSELYFIYMLQTLEDYNWVVKSALGHVIQCLCDKIPGTGELLNFFLTDGTTLWGYRQGKSLYYFYNPPNTTNSYSVLASQYPSSSQGSWITMSDGQLVTMNQSVSPVVENIKNYFSLGNTAPVAVNDAYTTSENTVLSVAAPGVLSNDTDADGNSLTAVKVGSPSHGSLSLNSNGSFIYTPSTGYSRSDSFTYQANDGTAYSNIGTVTITVTAFDFSITASPSSQSVSAGRSTTYTVKLTALNGYNLPVKLTVSGLPSGATYTFSTNPVTPISSGTSSKLTVTTNRNQRGTYTLTITGTGTDTASTTHSAKVTLTVR